MYCFVLQFFLCLFFYFSMFFYWFLRFVGIFFSHSLSFSCIPVTGIPRARNKQANEHWEEWKAMELTRCVCLSSAHNARGHWRRWNKTLAASVLHKTLFLLSFCEVPNTREEINGGDFPCTDLRRYMRVQSANCVESEAVLTCFFIYCKGKVR
jgi:hypothetical protein